MSGQEIQSMGATARRFGVVAVLISFASVALANTEIRSTWTPWDWVDSSIRKASERLDGVDKYVERIQGGEIPGLRAGLGPGQSGKCVSDCRVYTTVDVPLPDGSTLKAGHLLTPAEVAVLAGTSPTAASMDMFVGGYGGMQDAMAAGAEEMVGPFLGMARAAFGDISVGSEQVVEDMKKKSWEPGPHPASGSSSGGGVNLNEREAPWLNPFRMFGAGAYMFNEGAESVAEAEQGLGQSANKALADAQRQRQLLANAEIVGFENVGGARAVHIALPTGAPAGTPENFDGQTFVPTGASIWIDTDKLTMLKHRVDGTITADGQTRKIFIESERSDFRHVPGSDMYEPYRRVMRMGGMMDAAQMEQMKKAKQQLAEFDKKMASMPASQRAMMENMLGGQMDAVRNMTNSGAIEYVEIIKEILVNPNIRALYAVGPTGGGSLLPVSGMSLLAGIQADLRTLGYQPGNTNGVADAKTTAAISKFQADHKLAVTGKPSQALATTLAGLAGQ